MFLQCLWVGVCVVCLYDTHAVCLWCLCYACVICVLCSWCMCSEVLDGVCVLSVVCLWCMHGVCVCVCGSFLCGVCVVSVMYSGVFVLFVLCMLVLFCGISVVSFWNHV